MKLFDNRIEHLYEDDLSKVPAVVFGGLRPERALFTTPNSDFNVLFNNKTDRFRHPDHKFEWSRRQFEDWWAVLKVNILTDDFFRLDEQLLRARMY